MGDNLAHASVILVLNCGSSSIKYQLFRFHAGGEQLLCKGLMERIGETESVFRHQPQSERGEELRWQGAIRDHREGVQRILSTLVDPSHGVVDRLEEITAVGHRVAHGGSYFSKSALIDAEVERKIELCSEFAPLHNPANLLGIRVVRDMLPRCSQVAVFDTAFHQTLPEEAYRYALPKRYYSDYGVRKYGFHGTSHRFVVKEAARVLGTPLESLRLISCHLGNGASVAAVKGGRSIDTSMGFTPVDGLMMGTRCGAVDPGALLTIARKENLSYDQLDAIINRESGLLGVSGRSNDMRDIVEAASQGDPDAALALNIFCYRVATYIGAYIVAMGGVDAVIFTGGIGENSSPVRANVCQRLAFMGVNIDAALNERVHGEIAELNPTGGLHVLVLPTNEELLIAKDTQALTA